MKPKPKQVHQLNSLSKTQEVNYQREFKRADRAYQATSMKGNRS
ncbi:YfhE family protein [Virgibacillus sediminis]|uniref:YfhE family protein n=1 Tax=Virgibacillus sediminis TaxID=202260 RepID=A0ABV7A900_9BACI